MSLLTPPHSSQRETAAKFSFLLSVDVDDAQMASSSSSTSSLSRNVVWSPHNSYHSLTTPAKPPPSAASTNAWVMERPIRSILKKRRASPLADSTNSPYSSPSSPADVSGLKNLPEDLDTLFRTREATPEPSDPLCDLNYLAYPVSLILKEDAKPRELIEGYSVLAARLRTTVLFTTDSDASWPLFQPLRKHTNMFVDCVIRDLGRALIDPITTLDCPSSDQEEDAMKEWEEEDDSGGLPSPQKSPKKPKKRGMTAGQVKYARDLCTISHAALKLLCIMFSVPATYLVFEGQQLKSILNAALAIPMAESLPTPNARKTCALTILLLQCQRLPEDVVLPCRDRIALALKRGISGQLGKEGKKGSANDGLKAIHDLSIFQPTVFVPAFASGVFLRAILQNLVAPTLSLRVQACHALGGLSYALAALPPSSLHATVSGIVVGFLTTPAPATPVKSGKLSAPSLAPRDSLIIRTLRTTMSTSDATHIAQSSVWGISVISSLVVLVGSRMYTNKKVCQTLMNVLKLGVKSRKASIRHLFGLSWRTLAWAWFQPDYDTLEDDGEDEKTDVDDNTVQSRQRQRDPVKGKTREAYFQLLHEVVDMQVGMGTVLACLNCPAPSTANAGPHEGLQRALSILQTMANSSHPETISDAVQVVVNLLTTSPSPPHGKDNNLSQSSHPFLPRGLFSSHPTSGLLSADLSASNNVPGSVMFAMRPLFDQLPNLDQVRTLSRDELRQGWVWSKLCRIWRTILGTLEMTEEVEGIPEELCSIWEALVVSGLGRSGEDDDGEFVGRVLDVLVGVLEDNTLDFSIKDDTVPEASPSAASTATASRIPFPSSTESAASPESTTTASASGKHTKNELKIKVVKILYSIVRAVISKEKLSEKPLSKLFACLINPKNVSEWTAPRPRAAVTRKRPRTSSLSPWNGIPGMSRDAAAIDREALEPIRAWASLVAGLMSGADGESASGMMKAFWGLEGTEAVEDRGVVASWNSEVKSAVWKTVMSAWRKNEGCWEGAVVLLAVPFARRSNDDDDDVSVWSLSADETTRWKELYEYATMKALDYGMDGASVVDGVAEIVLASNEGYVVSRESSTPVNSPGSPYDSALASANIAASLIQLSDLLLEHLDISEARDLPWSLVSLVSDTLKLSYPPSSRNVSPATWLAQALTRVVENCPGSLVGSLVEGLSDGLAIWLSDVSEAWNEDILDYTFIPLYQHLLLRMQTVPKDLLFLEAVSTLLGSVFTGREMPEPVLSGFRETFAEFWTMSPYSKMDEPAGKWPKSIRYCLDLPDESDNDEEIVVPLTSTLLASPEIEESESSARLAASTTIVPATPKRPAKARCHKWDDDDDDIFTPRTPMAAINGSAHIPSPHRPHKDHLDTRMPFPLPMHSPMSPVRRRRRRTSSTGSSTNSGGSSNAEGLNFGLFKGPGLVAISPPRLGSGESAAKRRRVNSGEPLVVDKENASPLRWENANASPVRMGRRISAPLFEVASIVDRISASSAVNTSDARPPADGQIIEEEEENVQGRKKRSRMMDRMGAKQQKRDVSPAGSVSSTTSTSSNGSVDDERWVESMLLPFPTLESGKLLLQGEAVEQDKPVIVKKRKRIFMDAVVVPLLPKTALRKRKLEHATSFDASLLSTSFTSTSTSTHSTHSPPPAAPITKEKEWKTPTTGKSSSSAAEAMERAKRKRKRSLSMTAIAPSDEEHEEDPFEMEVSKSATVAPIRALLFPRCTHTRAHPLDDETGNGAAEDVPSSDDDPHLGQVTPHHIVSPPLAQRSGKVYMSKTKRGVSESGLGCVSFDHNAVEHEDACEDEDDEMMNEPGSSPSKKVAERRMLQRQNSLSTEGVQYVGKLQTVFSW